MLLSERYGALLFCSYNVMILTPMNHPRDSEFQIISLSTVATPVIRLRVRERQNLVDISSSPYYRTI